MIVRKVGSMVAIVLGIIFIFIGYGVIKYGLNEIQKEKDKNQEYVEIMATIVGHDENTKRKQAIIVEYVVNGKKYRKTSDKYTDEYKKVNTQVKIKYNPTNPEEVIFEEEISISNIATIVVGGIIIGLGAICTLSSIISLFTVQSKNNYNQINRPINNNINNTDRSLTEIANEQRVGVFDPSQGTTSPYVDQNNTNKM